MKPPKCCVDPESSDFKRTEDEAFETKLTSLFIDYVRLAKNPARSLWSK
jgi:hypothetical protein